MGFPINSKTIRHLKQCAWKYVLVTLMPSTAFAASTKHQRFCLQTFNAYGPAYASNLEQRTTALARELELSPCEIVQLQEVWNESHHERLLSALTTSLPFLSAVRFDHFQNPVAGNSGLSVFTSEILTDQKFEAFSVNTDGLMDNIRSLFGVIKGIGSSWITLRSDEQFRIHMINVHLHPSSQAVRITQIAQLIEHLENPTLTGQPVIVSGDFNFKPNSLEYRLMRGLPSMRDSFREVHGPYHAGECTYCENNPHHWAGVSGVIDYIWLKNGTTIQLNPLTSQINLRGINGVVPSDHYGLRVQIEAAIQESLPAPDDVSMSEETENTILDAIKILDSATQLTDQVEWARTKLLNWRSQHSHRRQRT